MAIKTGEPQDNTQGNQQGNKQENRLDNLLEERFSRRDRRAMVDKLLAQDRAQGRPPGPAEGLSLGAAPVDPAWLKKQISCQGPVGAAARRAVEELAPPLLAWAAGQGLRLRDQNHRVTLYTKNAFQQVSGAPIGNTITLPASSYRYSQLYRVYTVNLVVDEGAEKPETPLAALRVLLSRLLGDIYLREEVFTREPYRQETARRQEGVSGSLPEMALLLAAQEGPLPALEQAVKSHAKRLGPGAPKQAALLRKAFFQSVRQELEAGRLARETEEALERAFGQLAAGWSRDLAAALAGAVAQVEEANRTVNFLPPAELPHYGQLARQNRLHYLRSAQARLQFVMAAMESLRDGFMELEKATPGAGALLENYLEGMLEELARLELARPYLIEGARLSPALQRAKRAFPFELHRLLSQMEPQPDAAKAFARLEKRFTGSLYQKLYLAGLELKSWIKARGQGEAQERAFKSGPRFGELKGLIHNFGYRLETLAPLAIQAGLLVEMGERSGSRQDQAGLPLAPLTRGWSHFVSHQLLLDYFSAQPGLLPGFDPARFASQTQSQLLAQLPKGGHYPLAWLFFSLHRQAQAHAQTQGSNRFPQPWPFLLHLLATLPGGFRHAAIQAGHPPKGVKDQAGWQSWVEGLAAQVVRVEAGRFDHAILPQDIQPG